MSIQVKVGPVSNAPEFSPSNRIAKEIFDIGGGVGIVRKLFRIMRS